MDPWTYAKTTEHSHQVALFMWAAMAEKFGLLQADDPESYKLAGYAQRNYYERGGPLLSQLKWLHAVHNQGHGDAIRGAKARAEGVKAGVADIFLPVPMLPFGMFEPTRYHGLYIELKVGNGKPSDIQNEFMSDMINNGYYSCIVYGWLEARKIILDYLHIPLDS